MTKKGVIVAAALLALPWGVRAQNLNWDQGVNVKVLVSRINHQVPAVRAALAKGAATSSGFCLFDGRTGLPVSARAAFGRALRSRVVYAGEEHTDLAHHHAQLELLNRMIAAHPRAAAGFEMLDASRQVFLDRYLNGVLTADQFQKAVDWQRTWSVAPFSFYRPLFEALRSQSRLGVALNIPESVPRAVARGGLKSLSPEERQSLPPDFQTTTDPQYLAALRDIFAEHGRTDPVFFRHMVSAMSLWNEGMAYHLKRFLDAHPDSPVLVVAGVFHSVNAGIPASLSRRMPGVSQTSFVLADSPSCPLRLSSRDLTLKSDYVWLVSPR